MIAYGCFQAITSRCRMFICPRKHFYSVQYAVNQCVLRCNCIFEGQTGDKILHTKRKKNTKTLFPKGTLKFKGRCLSLTFLLFVPSLSLGLKVRFGVNSEMVKAKINRFSLVFVYLIKF